MFFKFNDFKVENKMYYKTISEFLSWIGNKSNRDFVFFDSETTGLLGSNTEQLTQVAAISTTYNITNNDFTKLGEFNRKIKLTDFTKSRFKSDKNVKWVLGFNHYGDGKHKYLNEFDVLIEFKEWLSQFNNPILIIQNASFDMDMLNGRSGGLFKNEVIDTKMIIQLYYLPTLQKLAESDVKYQEIINKIGTSTRDNGLISSSMSKIGPALEIDMTNYHDGLKDCEITIEMLSKMIDFLNTHKYLDISKYQLERINNIR